MTATITTNGYRYDRDQCPRITSSGREDRDDECDVEDPAVAQRRADR